MFKFIISLCYLSPIRLPYFFSSYTPPRKHAPSHTNPYHPEDTGREWGVSRQRASGFWNHLGGDREKRKCGSQVEGDWIPTVGVEVLGKAVHVALVRGKVQVSRIAASAGPERGLRQQKGLGVQDFPGNGGGARQKTRISRRS